MRFSPDRASELPRRRTRLALRSRAGGRRLRPPLPRHRRRHRAERQELLGHRRVPRRRLRRPRLQRHVHAVRAARRAVRQERRHARPHLRPERALLRRRRRHLPATRSSRGIACAGDGECLFDFVCVAGKCDDTTRAARGDTCVATSPPCRGRRLLRRHRLVRRARRRRRATAPRPTAAWPGWPAPTASARPGSTSAAPVSPARRRSPAAARRRRRAPPASAPSSPA